MPVDEQSVAEMTLALQRMGLADGARPSFTPLTGGVSSDIFLVASAGRTFVVKRALEKLRVAADWRAPLERNDYELAWLETAGRIVPEAVPAILGHDREAGLFAMAYLPPEDYPVWKTQLRDGRVDAAFAAEVGRRLATIHAATADDPLIARRFPTDDIFRSIRLEPYLEATAAKHPGLAGRLFELSRRTLEAHRCLVHGDVSPKNILCGPHGPVFLDAECAWYGEPAFDLAFCLNHLLLKCLWNRAAGPALLEAFAALASAYLEQVTWEMPAALEARSAALLPALALARIDGKSPVEYITRDSEREWVRQTAVSLSLDAPALLADIRAAWAARLATLPADEKHE